MTDGLVDRDALGKLVAADLWQETLGILELERVWRLPSAHADNLLKDIGVPRRGRPALPPEQVAEIEPRVRHVTGSLPTIGAVDFDRSLVDRLIQHPAIDQGEGQLLAALEARPGDHLLITGDKRFLEALRHYEPELFEARRDRLVSLERCLLRLIERRGVEAIRPNLRVLAHLDRSTALALGGDGMANEASVVEGLRSWDPLR